MRPACPASVRLRDAFEVATLASGGTPGGRREAKVVKAKDHEPDCTLPHWRAPCSGFAHTGRGPEDWAPLATAHKLPLQKNMTFGDLIWSSLARNWPRSLFAFAAIASAFGLFAVLESMGYWRDRRPRTPT